MRHMGAGTGPGPVLTGLGPVPKLGPVPQTVTSLMLYDLCKWDRLSGTISKFCEIRWDT